MPKPTTKLQQIQMRFGRPNYNTITTLFRPTSKRPQNRISIITRSIRQLHLILLCLPIWLNGKDWFRLDSSICTQPLTRLGFPSSLIHILTLLSNLDTLRIMNPSYLFYRKTGGSYLFRRPFHSISNRHLNLDSFNYLWVVASSDNPNKLSLYLNQVTQSLYNSIRENPEIKKTNYQ